MTADPGSIFKSHSHALLILCVAGSVAAHVLILTLLPGWNAWRSNPPRPLTVELSKLEAAEIVPPHPMETRPAPAAPEPVKQAVKQTAEPSVAREAMLSAPPQVTLSPAAPVVPVAPEHRLPQPAAQTEPPRTQPAPVATSAPVTPPRYDAAYLRNPLPEYPLVAKRRGEVGKVMVLVQVTTDGNPARVTIDKSSGSTALDNAALRAVSRWKFIPGRDGNQPVQAEVIVPVNFTLNSQ